MLTPIIIWITVLISLIEELQVLLRRSARMIGGWYPGLVMKKYTPQVVFERGLPFTKPGHLIIRGLTNNDIQIIKDRVFDII